MKHMPLPTRQRGVTLVELMVTIVINLVLVLAATLLYLNTRTVQRSVNERAAIFESAQLALDLIGREIGNAAFYPAVSVEPATALDAAPATNVLWSHDMAAKAMSLPASYEHGVFGCSDQRFDSKVHACEKHASDEPAKGSDALVLSYFTNDAMSLGVGQRADCTRTSVESDPRNKKRLGSGTADGLGTAPDSPLFVANRFQLKKATVTTESGTSINTSALVCSGNGRDRTNEASDYVQLIQGVEQFVVRYGVMNDASLRPTTFIDADAVTALDTVSIDGVAYPGWQRVVAVRVCLLVRALGNNTALRDASGNASAITDCTNTALTPPQGAQMRRFEQTFSVKNRQTNTL